MRETWYLLEDGRVVCPSEVAPTDDNRLAHTSGVLVAMRGDVPHSVNVDPEEERAKDMEPDAPRPKRQYRTREMKAKD